MATCSSCEAPILWVVIKATGRSMPVNAAPDPLNGMIEVLAPPPDTPPEVPLEAIVHDQRPMVPPGNTLHVTHFATCPYAGQHRKRRR